MSEFELTPRSVEALYVELARERAGRARAALAAEPTVEGLFAEQAGALLAVAARFEEAADLSRTRHAG